MVSFVGTLLSVLGMKELIIVAIVLVINVIAFVLTALLLSAWKIRNSKANVYPYLREDYFIGNKIREDHEEAEAVENAAYTSGVATTTSSTSSATASSNANGSGASSSGSSERVDLSMIIPAFNEEERLPIMLDETLEYLATKNMKWEIILVDDCSKDGMIEMLFRDYKAFIDPVVHKDALAAAKNNSSNGRSTALHGKSKSVKATKSGVIRVVRLKENQGKGFAVKAGMLSARGDLRLMVDADGATKFSDLDKLLKTMDSHDIAFGSRHHLMEGATAKRAWYRNIFTFGLHLLVRVLIIGPKNDIIHDTQCGFKLFKKDAAEKLFGSQHIRRWAFDLELLFLAQLHGLKVAEIAVAWTEIPGSKLSLLSGTINMLKDMLRIRLSYMFGIWTVFQSGDSGADLLNNLMNANDLKSAEKKRLDNSPLEEEKNAKKIK